MMDNFACRLCQAEITNSSKIISFSSMPSIAQNLPQKSQLLEDKGVDFDVLQCNWCGLIQLNCQAVPYYKSVIRASLVSSEMTSFRKLQFQKWINKFGLEKKTILEIGCGNGEYLSLLSKYCEYAVGIEYSQKAVELCKKNGLNVIQGFPTNNLKLPNYKADGFICLSFAEHWPDPVNTLKNIHKILSEGAIGIIEVPNTDMIIEEGLCSEFMTDHLCYFTKKTLKTLMSITGFEVLDMDVVWNGYILSAVVKKQEKVKFKIGMNKKANLSMKILDYVNNSNHHSGVAIWGASHQAFSILAMAKLGQDIRYIVDSAEFKQGKFSPATHIPIFSPSKLNEAPVSALIVMASSYTKEVLEQIRKKYRFIEHVAVVENDEIREIY